jgi:dolichyldiphosphatase
MFAGQMACEGANFLLKRYIKEERPRTMHGKGYGMPSSHAQFVTFFGVYLSLFLMLRHQPHKDTGAPLSSAHRLFVSVAALGGAAAVASSRVYLGYHTPKQVCVGVIAGFTLAVSWFVVTIYLRRSGWIDWGLDTRIARGLRMRDLVIGEDLPEAGWTRWQVRRAKKRSIKAS